MKNRKRGASLLYVLIVLSMVTIFAIEFVYFVNERNKIINIKSKS